MMNARIVPEDAAKFEWESLLGEIKYAGQDIKRYVEARDYERFADRLGDAINADALEGID